ncbi:hypothetical protein BDV93DRAFT_546025 [Ceratobasidium sp. AG-I]|nr:hypothetical protein BDV93DRAFT_546025 [Ceratobasidium sp. AG-I]
MTQNDKYTIIIHGKRYVLTKAQVEFDSPNYFTKQFFGDTPEAQSRTLELSRDPDLFKLVLDYLSDYWIIPLNVPAIPPRSAYRTLNDLLRDAKFYQLGKLESACQGLMPAAGEAAVKARDSLKQEKYIVMTRMAQTENNEADTARIYEKGYDSYMYTRISEDKLSLPTLSGLNTLQSSQSFMGIRELGFVRKVATVYLKGENIIDWKLIGWKSNGSYSDKTGLIIVLEDLSNKEYVWSP